jgi:hypothetical protein
MFAFFFQKKDEKEEKMKANVLFRQYKRENSSIHQI